MPTIAAGAEVSGAAVDCLRGVTDGRCVSRHDPGTPPDRHDGQRSTLYSFVSTGALAVDHILDEIHHNLRLVIDRALRIELQELVAFVSEHGDRGPVEGWSSVWE